MSHLTLNNLRQYSLNILIYYYKLKINEYNDNFYFSLSDDEKDYKMKQIENEFLEYCDTKLLKEERTVDKLEVMSISQLEYGIIDKLKCMIDYLLEEEEEEEARKNLEVKDIYVFIEMLRILSKKALDFLDNYDEYIEVKEDDVEHNININEAIKHSPPIMIKKILCY
jgi:hypothetical protein